MDPEEIDPIHKMMELMRFHNNAEEKMRAIAKKEQENAERQIMMDLWGWLSNNTETYSEAFDAVADYTKALKATRKHIPGRSHAITIRLAEALAAQVALDSELYRKMEEASEELQKNMPKL